MSGILYLLMSALLIGADYFIKQWAALSLKPVTTIDIIPNVLSLYYHENFGAAFGILQQRRFFLVTVTGVVIAVFIGAILLKKVNGNLILTAMSLIIAGGMGNLIDRVTLGYVIDYIYFEPINFPIFNLADCCVVVGTSLLAVYILFSESKIKAEDKAKKKTALPPSEGEE